MPALYTHSAITTESNTDSSIELQHTYGKQEAQLSPSDRAMRLVSSNLANSAETTYTTSPDQTDGTKLKV